VRLQLQTGAPASGVVAEVERLHQGVDTRVLRGRIAVGAPLPDWPDSGVYAVLRLPRLDADAWAAAVKDAGADLGGAPASDEGYWPTRVGLQVQELRLAERVFNQVSVGGTRSGDRWQLSVAARELDGYLEVQGGAQERLLARLAHLRLPPGAADEVERLAAQPRTIPALDIVVDDFELAGLRLGRLELLATNRMAQQGNVGVREWRLQTLKLSVPEARLSASGNWAPIASLTGPAQAASARRTALQLRLDIDDAGALLSRLGFPGTLRGGRGQLEGSLGWLGSPLALDLPSLSGELTLAVQNGQFLKADAGAAKLLGVLSLQSLPRRLTLDFRDVFSEGFAFDSVRGKASIARGVISTRDLQMRGVNAAVLIEGSADLVRETQDLTVVVVPEINAGTASLLAAFVNPVTGLGSLVAQWLLREPLRAATTQTFRITGRWDDPQIERLQRTIAPADNPPPQEERSR
jgi:uncharacterized protein YhdP